MGAQDGSSCRLLSSRGLQKRPIRRGDAAGTREPVIREHLEEVSSTPQPRASGTLAIGKPHKVKEPVRSNISPFD